MTTVACLYGRPGTKAEALRREVHELLLRHQAAGELPTSNRFLFYELVQAGAVDKQDAAATAIGRRPRHPSGSATRA